MSEGNEGGHDQGETLDLFVSYAHNDNGVPRGVARGWVTALKDNLEIVLNRKLARGSRLWMDHQLPPNHPVSKMLREKRVSRSRALLTVVSPSYCYSEWCRIELDDFLAAALARGQENAVFPVEMEPVDRLVRPPALQDLKPIPFWEGKPESALLSGFPEPDPKGHAWYWSQVNALAQAIADHLKLESLQYRLPPQARQYAPPMIATAPVQPADTVIAEDLSLYLHAAPEDQPSVERIAGHLEQSGLTVYMTPPPSKGQTYLDCLQAQQYMLGQCDGLLLVNGLSPVNNLQAAFMMAQRAFGVRRPGVWGAALNLRPAAGAQVHMRSPKLMQVDCSDGFSVAQLMPFLRGLRANGAAPGLASHV